MYYIVTIFIPILGLIWPNLFHNVFVDGPSLAKSLLFIPYMKYTSGPILSSGWTLNYEIYFYLLLSLFLIFTKNIKRILFYTSLLLIMVYVLQQSNYFTNYYLSIYGNPIVLEFIFGAVLYWLYKNYKLRFNKKPVLFFRYYRVPYFFIIGYFNFNQLEGNRLLLYGIPSFFLTSFFVMSENSWRTDSLVYQWLYRLGNSSYVIHLIIHFF